MILSYVFWPGILVLRRDGNKLNFCFRKHILCSCYSEQKLILDDFQAEELMACV